MRRFAVFIALATLATASVFIGCASAADGNQCEGATFSSGTPVVQNAVWRMEVLIDEAAYNRPSIHDRLNHNWTSDAKTNYRWTSTAMPVDAGESTQLMIISAAVIGEGVPLLEKGDIVDVYVVSRGIDYGKGRAPVVVRRICAARDERCLDGLPFIIGSQCTPIVKGGGTARE